MQFPKIIVHKEDIPYVIVFIIITILMIIIVLK